MSELLTAKQLVAELERRGIGTWTPAVVRRWIHEEPPCPIGKRGRKGQSHLYDADQVMAWLRARDERAGIARDEQAGAEPVPQPAAAPAEDGGIVAKAQERAGDNEIIRQLLLVLQGRDPRNWKAAEEAQLTRLKRLSMEGELVNVAELEHCLQVQGRVFITGASELRNQLKMALASVEDPGERVAVIDREVDLFLQRIADAANRLDAAAAGELEEAADVG